MPGYKYIDLQELFAIMILMFLAQLFMRFFGVIHYLLNMEFRKVL